MLIVDPRSCTSFSIQQDISHQIWEGVSSSSGHNLPIWLIRVVHNKLRYNAVNYTQCYLNFLSPSSLIKLYGWSATIITLVLLGFIIYKFKKLRPIIIAAILLYPLIMVFEV